MNTAVNVRPASPKQVALLNRLAAERGADIDTSDLSIREASNLIERMLATPAPQRAVSVAAVGIYKLGETVAKVQRSKTSGNLYAQKLVAIGGERLTDTEAVVRWEFQYAPGLVRDLTPDMLLTLEEARAFGIRFGVCCVCGLTLKDAKSVAAGIGPVCAKKIAK